MSYNILLCYWTGRILQNMVNNQLHTRGIYSTRNQIKKKLKQIICLYVNSKRKTPQVPSLFKVNGNTFSS